MKSTCATVAFARQAWWLPILAMAAVFAPGIAAGAEEALAGDAESAPPTVLITGSNRGIGLALSKYYAGRNWRVIATCRRPEQAEELQAIAAEHDNLVIELLDVTSEDQIAALTEQYADRPIDLLINNAAILGTLPEQSLGGLDYESFQQTMAVNVFGPLRVSEALSGNVEAAGGKIVAITSGMGSISLMSQIPVRGFYFYRMSKAALNMGWRALRADLKPRGVAVLLVAPGVVDTRLSHQSGYRGPALTPEQSAASMADIFANASLEDPGEPINVDGKVIPW